MTWRSCPSDMARALHRCHTHETPDTRLWKTRLLKPPTPWQEIHIPRTPKAPKPAAALREFPSPVPNPGLQADRPPTFSSCSRHCPPRGAAAKSTITAQQRTMHQSCKPNKTPNPCDILPADMEKIKLTLNWEVWKHERNWSGGSLGHVKFQFSAKEAFLMDPPCTTEYEVKAGQQQGYE